MTRSKVVLACAVALVGTFFMPLGWVLTLVFFRTRKAAAVLMGLIQGLHGVNYALFPHPSDTSMIDALKYHPVASVAFEIAGAIVVWAIFYWIGTTRIGRWYFDDPTG